MQNTPSTVIGLLGMLASSYIFSRAFLAASSLPLIFTRLPFRYMFSRSFYYADVAGFPEFASHFIFSRPFYVSRAFRPRQQESKASILSQNASKTRCLVSSLVITRTKNWPVPNHRFKSGAVISIDVRAVHGSVTKCNDPWPLGSVFGFVRLL